jgi:hypothetical protein
LFTVIFAGQVITGGCTSLTVTVKVQVAVLPVASVAVEVTVVVPTGKNEPEAGTAATVTPGQLSVAFTAKFTTAPHWLGSLLTVIFAGQVITGGCTSFTVTVNVQVAVLPAASVAVAVTVVVPTGKKEPDGGTATTVTPGQLSVADTTKFTTAPHWLGSLPTVILAGQVTTGGCVSLIVTSNEQLTGPQALVAVTVTVVVPKLKNEPLPVPAPLPVVAPLKL